MLVHGSDGLKSPCYCKLELLENNEFVNFFFFGKMNLSFNK